MKILVADNHTLFREGFSRQLQRFGALTELQEVTDFAAVEKLAQEGKSFDLIFVDRDVLGADWKESFKKMHAMFAASRLIVNSTVSSPRRAQASAASMPACPAPMTPTSAVYCMGTPPGNKVKNEK